MGGPVGTLLSAILPATCLLCERELEWASSRAGVCARCWASVERHEQIGCPLCGDPGTVPNTPCLTCRDAPQPWRAATSFGPYRGALRELVLRFKTRGADDLDRPLGEMLVSAWRVAGWVQPALITSVPMTSLRRLRRGYDQAELLARQVARELETPFISTLSRRPGRPQERRTRAERLMLRSTAFRERRPLEGTILLVDDVLTTGATAAACTRALLRAGADAVDVLTLARAERPGRMP
jgi:ComF family protein